MTRHRLNPIDDSLDPNDLFDSIKSKLAQRPNGAEEDGITVDLFPITEEPTPDSPPPHSESAASTRLDIGSVLGERFVIESQMASGGMGTVYKALDRSRSEHTQTDAYVAIKVLHEKTRTRSDVLAKLRREFYCAQALSHRSVVKVYELDLHQTPFFTMELIDGESLPQVMQKFHPLPLPRPYVWAIIREAGDGLAHAHERRVIHGDVKPQNIMVTNSGEVRILDFGTSGDLTTAATPAYSSCELLEGREPDARDDLFAFACLSYELLAGEHPFQRRRATEARAMKLEPHRPPGLSSRQWKALSQALAWERTDRPRSVRHWMADLELGRAPLGPIPLPENSKAALFSKSAVTSAVIALLAAVIVGGVTWAVLSRPKPAPVVADAPADTAVITPPVIDSTVSNSEIDDAPQPAEAKAAANSDVKARAAAAARPIDKTERIGMTAAAYSFRSREKFAEIRVHRSTGSKGATSFEWWTEPDSALAGTDFAGQAPATVFFPAGVRTVSLFIKLLPNAARKRTAVFYVVLGNTSSGSALSNVTKASISLHP
ncbi:MAG TPA: protein kinase [Steroidobacteraceae bacterium]|nr:protein kinase [Steroidobacteraceae bacterium]